MIMNSPQIHSIFPKPIYFTNIGRKFTKKEINFVKQQKNHSHNNEGNITSDNNYLLKKPEFKNINKILTEHCQKYLDTVICPKDNIKLYITQSWLNYTDANQFHHKHEHPNSVVSGVLYFDSDINNDKILFSHSKGYQQISPIIDDKKFNLWNSATWFFPVKTGDLVMFPSSTTHQVQTKKGNNTRISLAFNTFYKGDLGGSRNGLSELIL